MVLPSLHNQRWPLDPHHDHTDQWRSPDPISDQLTVARPYRVLTAVDDCTHDCLALIADISISGARAPVMLFDTPAMFATVVSAKGTQFTPYAILMFADEYKCQ